MSDGNGEIVLGVSIDTGTAEKQLKELTKDLKSTFHIRNLTDGVEDDFRKIVSVFSKIKDLQKAENKGTDEWKLKMKDLKTEYWSLLKIADFKLKASGEEGLLGNNVDFNNTKLKFNYFKSSMEDLYKLGLISTEGFKSYLYAIQDIGREDETLAQSMQAIIDKGKELGVVIEDIYPKIIGYAKPDTSGIDNAPGIQSFEESLKQARIILASYKKLMQENNGVIDRGSEGYKNLKKELNNFGETTLKGRDQINLLTQSFTANTNSLGILVNMGLISKQGLLALREAVREYNANLKQSDQVTKTLNTDTEISNETKKQAAEIVKTYNALISENNGYIDKNSEEYKKLSSLLYLYMGATQKCEDENIDLANSFIVNSKSLTSLYTDGYMTKEGVFRLKEAFKNLKFEQDQERLASDLQSGSLHKVSNQVSDTNQKTSFLTATFKELGKSFKSNKISATDYTKQLKQLTTSLRTVSSRLRSFYSSFRRLSRFTLTMFGLNKFFTSINDVNNAFKSFEQSTQKLEALMKSRMAATNADVQSIRDLIDAQTDLGIVSRNNQLAGAQQLSTYVTMKSSLETLIPVMNNAAAQAYGVNVTTSNMESIAKLFGKAINGQTEALKRAGYAISDYDKKLLETGTEEQRVSALSRIITQRVGNMNEVLAATDSGKQQQLANTMEEVQVEFGRAISTIRTVLIPVLSRLVRVLSNVAYVLNKFANTVRAVFGKSKSNIVSTTDDLEDYTEAVEDAAEATDDLLGPYDKLNVEKQSSAAEDATDFAGLTSALLDMSNTIDDVDAKWMAFLEKFKTDDWFGIGNSLSNGIVKSLKSINWEDIKSKASEFGTNLGNFINGFFTEDLFTSLGTTIGELLNTAVIRASSFLTTVRWSALGSNFAEGINKFFKTFDFKKFTEGVNALLNGIIDLTASIITSIDYGEIIKSLGSILSNLDWGGVAKIMAGVFTVKIITAGLVAGFSSAKSAIISKITGAFTAASSSSTLATQLAIPGSQIGGIMGTSVSTGLAAGIMGAGAVIIAGLGVAINEVKKEGQYWEDYRQWLVDISMPTEEWQARIDELADKTKALVDESNARIQKLGDINVDYTAIQNMADEYFNLAEKQGKSDEELNKMKMLHDTLIKEYPEFESILDDEKKTYDDQKKSIQDLIVEMQNKAKQKAIEDMLVETYKQQYEAEKNLEKAQDDYNEAYTEYEKNRAGYKSARDKYLEYVEQAKRGELEYTNLMIEAKKEMDNQYEAYSRSASAVLGLKGNVDDASDVLNQINGEIDDYTKAFSKSMDTTQKETKETVEETKKSLPDITSGFGDIVSKFKTFGQNILQGLNNGLQDNTILGKIGSSISNVTSLISNIFTRQTKIGSPSKLFKQYGQWIDEGLAIGIDNGTSDVKSSMSEMSDLVSKGLTMPNLAYGSTLPTNGKFSSSVTTGISNSTASLLSGLAGQLKTIIDSSDKDVIIQIDGKNVFNAVRNQNNNYKKMTGSTAF